MTIDLSRLVAHLSGRGHSLLLFGPCYSTPTLHGVRVHRAPSFPIGMYPGLHFSILSPRLAYALWRFRPHIVLLVDPFFLGAETLAFVRVALPSAPLVAAHCTNVPFYTAVLGHPSVAPGEWAYLRLAHGLCTRTIVRSASSAKALCRMGGFDEAKMRLWTAGVDARRFSPEKRCLKWRMRCCGQDARRGEDDNLRNADLVRATAQTHMRTWDDHWRIVLYVGRVSWEKNIGALVDLARRLKELKVSARTKLVMVGDGPAVKEFFSLLDKRGAADAVVYLGWLSGDELAAAYASADVFVCPSVSETLGNVVVEAMASGLPVVAFDSEGVKDSVIHGVTGILVPGVEGLQGEEAADVDAWVQAVVDLVSDASGSKLMGQRGRVRALGWTMEQSLEGCETILLEVSTVTWPFEPPAQLAAF